MWTKYPDHPMNPYFRLAYSVRQLGDSWEAWQVDKDLGGDRKFDYRMALTHALDAQSLLQKCIDEIRKQEEGRPSMEFIDKSALGPLS